MDVEDLVRALSDPAAYPHPAGDVVVHHTHISLVFLAGALAYKVKKPLDLGFLDFTTLDRRRRFCLEEVRLNARLAPGVYHGVVPLFARGRGLRVGTDPIAPDDPPAAAAPRDRRILEYAVRMERLPDDATLESRVASGEAGAGLLAAVARRIAAFHASAAAGEGVSACGRLEVVAGNSRENFEQCAPQAGTTVFVSVLERLRRLTEDELRALGPIIEERARRGVPRDTHGDLRLDHVYVFPERASPHDLVVVDCIEFNERFRYADPVADAAFLAMDLAFAGRRDLAGAFVEAYLEATGDEEGRLLFPFYAAYRAAVRAKVEGFEALSTDVPEGERSEALRASRGHWLLALVELEAPGRRPCLVLVGGLPGTGKSTLAGRLAGEAGLEIVASDAVRKELAGIEPGAPARSGFGTGLYTAAWNDRTYTECLRRAEARLFEGGRVLVDASFREDARRRAFLEAARAWGVPALLLICEADPRLVRGRLARRQGGLSDADRDTYVRAAEAWDEPGPGVRERTQRVPAGGAPAEAVAAALRALRAEGLG